MNDLTMKHTGKIIKELREKTGESQEQLAEALQAPNRETIARWENGSRDLKREHIIAIAKHFNVSTDYLLGLSDNPSVDPDIQTACQVTGLSEKAINNITSFKLDYDFPVVLHNIILKSVMNSVVDEIGFICDFLESDEFSKLFSALGKSVINKIAAYIESEMFFDQSECGTKKSLDKYITYNGHYSEISKAYAIDLYEILKNFIDNYVKEFQEDFQKKAYNNSDQKECKNNAEHNPTSE